MPFAGLFPSREAIYIACRSPLDAAPRDPRGQALHIIQRAAVIDREWLGRREDWWSRKERDEDLRYIPRRR